MIDQEFIKIGSIVRLDTSDGWEDEEDAIAGEDYRIVGDMPEFYFSGETVGICAVEYNPKDFTFVSYNAEKLPLSKNVYGIADTITPQDIDPPTIARPILTERKVGKVKMQLFDEGFPNAVMEIARVMTWAEEKKGYKPNDFKNLPNADVEFPAAASRHRIKGFIQKADGVAAIDRVDDESGIVHLAHAAFNVLAELELVMTGKIK